MPFKISAYIAFLADASDISKPGSGSGYDEDLARELQRIGTKGGTLKLTYVGLLDLAEWLDAIGIGESQSENYSGARSCATHAAKARQAARQLQS